MWKDAGGIIDRPFGGSEGRLGELRFRSTVGNSHGQLRDELLLSSHFSRVTMPFTLKHFSLITSAYFVQDGFVRFVTAIYILWLSSHLETKVSFVWRVVDAFTLISLGYLVFYGIEQAKLDFIRWPSLALFLYRVVEYSVEHSMRFSRSGKGVHENDGTTSCSRPVEWVGHFLLPSLHLVVVTIHLWTSLPPGCSSPGFSSEYSAINGSAKCTTTKPIVSGKNTKKYEKCKRNGEGSGSGEKSDEMRLLEVTGSEYEEAEWDDDDSFH